MFHIILVVIGILACLKWGDWRNWRLYYPTIIFCLFGDLLYNLLTYNNPLWIYNSSRLNHTLTDILTSLVFFPCILLVYLRNVAHNTLLNQILHTLLGILIFSVAEYISLKLGAFSYANGWNLFYSIVFNCIMFPILNIHHKKPLIGITLSAIIVFLIIWNFKLPIMQLR